MDKGDSEERAGVLTGMHLPLDWTACPADQAVEGGTGLVCPSSSLSLLVKSPDHQWPRVESLQGRFQSGWSCPSPGEG